MSNVINEIVKTGEIVVTDIEKNCTKLFKDAEHYFEVTGERFVPIAPADPAAVESQAAAAVSAASAAAASASSAQKAASDAAKHAETAQAAATVKPSSPGTNAG